MTPVLKSNSLFDQMGSRPQSLSLGASFGRKTLGFGLVRTVAVAVTAWVLVITFLHATLNLHVFSMFDRSQTFKIGFLPVTCHLTCPVTDFINKQIAGHSDFEPLRFQGWPELKEAFLAGDTQGTFILAPLAIKLREDGVPIKIVYLGHRDGSAMVVNKDSDIFRIEDLAGKTIAIPNRYSNQWLLVFKALRDHNVDPKSVKIVEMPPPDMPAALYSHAVDAVTSGEPFMGQTELDGYGRVLYLTKDIWPNFISCVLAVNERAIKQERNRVQELVDGIAQSGKWLDQSINHRMEAAEFVSQYYYHQNPRLMRFVLSKPPDRVKYTNLALHKPDFLEIENLGKAAGILRGTATFADYADPSFVPPEKEIQTLAWEYQQ